MRITDTDRNDFLMAFIPWGSRDIECAITALNESGIEFTDFAEWVNEYIEECETSLDKIDCVYSAYHKILLTVQDEGNEGMGEIIDYIVPGYCCTTIDMNPEEVQEILDRVDPDERYDAWNWVAINHGTVEEENNDEE